MRFELRTKIKPKRRRERVLPKLGQLGLAFLMNTLLVTAYWRVLASPGESFPPLSVCVPNEATGSFSIFSLAFVLLV